MTSLNQLLNSYCKEKASYHKLAFLLTNNKINEEGFFDNKNFGLLDQPLRIYEYEPLNSNDDIEEYSKFEMGMIINKLLEERGHIVKFFEFVNNERKVFTKKL